MYFEFLADSTEKTEEFGALLAKKLDTGGTSRAFIALRGEMGVGKTAFVRGFAGYFEIRGVRSPTYTVVNEYAGRVRIYHFDMYRLEDEDDLFSIGYEDYMAKDGYVLCEWSENIEEFIPSGALGVTIERVPGDEGKRLIKAEIPDEFEELIQ